MLEHVGVDSTCHVNLANNVFTRSTFAMVIHGVLIGLILVCVVQIMKIFALLTLPTINVQELIFLQIIKNAMILINILTTSSTIVLQEVMRQQQREDQMR